MSKGTSVSIIGGGGSSGSGSITIGTTTITSGTDTRVLFDDGGVIGESSGLTYTKGTTTLNISTIKSLTGVNFALSATAPTATTGASQVGKTVSITASDAVASTDTNGAAAGGVVTITSGAAARRVSGDANGGNISLVTGAGIGTGTAGVVLVPSSATAGLLSIASANDITTGFRLDGTNKAITFYGNNTALGVMISGATYLRDSSTFGFASGDPATTSTDTYLSRAAAKVFRTADGNGTNPTWLQQTAARSRVNGNVDNITNVMANITGLSATLIAGRKYTGELILKCVNTTAAEGIAVDFDGGNATMTSFAAGAGVLTGGTRVIVNEVSSALATDFDWSTITGETWIIVKFTLVCNAAGTFIPRFRESTAHTSGTATISLGSYMWLEDTP